MADRARILFVLPSLRGGGAERAVVILLRHINRERFELHLAVLHATGPYLSELPADVKIHDLRRPRVRQALPALIGLIRKLRPHAVISSLIELNMAAVAAARSMRGAPRLILREDTSPGVQLRGVNRLLYRKLYSRADCVICVADFVLNDLASNFGISKLVRIYNPVEVDQVRRMAAQAGSSRPDSNPRFIAIGRLERVKGFDVLLEAMAIVQKDLPSAGLMILGEGSMENELKSHAERLGIAGSVRFAGFQANPYGYMQHADVQVLSSRYEGLPLALLEAMALGLPVVAADCPGGVREVVERWPLGRLVPPEDAVALAGAMIESYRAAESRQVESAALNAAIAPFDAARIAREYEAMFDKLMGGEAR